MAAKPLAHSKQLSLTDFAIALRSEPSAPKHRKPANLASAGAIADYVRRFPAKVAKKAVREEETVVCAIRHPDGSYLIQRRPPKGLLAGLWELPSTAPCEPGAMTAKTRAQAARSHAATLVASSGLEHVGELGSVPWLFSHIKLTMHVHLFVAARGSKCELTAHKASSQPRRWSQGVDAESMGTGMRRCWALVKDAEPASD